MSISHPARSDLANFAPIAAVVAMFLGLSPLWKVSGVSVSTPSQQGFAAPIEEEALPGFSGARSVYAGLWGDPFSGISNGKAVLEVIGEPEVQSSGEEATTPDYRQLLSRFKRLTLLPVIVRGGDADSERYDRINYRHAVELALAENDFSMEFPDRMSFASVTWEIRKDGDVFSWASEVPIKLYSRPTQNLENSEGASSQGNSGTKEALLVCWIDNRLLGDKPLTTLSEVLSQISGQPDYTVSLIGPIYSGELTAVVDELEHGMRQVGKKQWLANWKIYSPTATDYDKRRLERIREIVPLIGMDSQVVDLLVDEIKLRRLHLGQIVIFSEASAVSPRSLSSQLVGKLGEISPPLEYRYLKGFGDASPQSSESVSDYFLRILEKSAKSVGAPAGSREVSAVIVLGDEIEDKLALVKVAKSVFPNATCLTHDLYARYFENVAYCKGLIVASHGGLSDQLGGRPGAATVEFRDCYQRSVYSATTLAVKSKKLEPPSNGVSLFEVSNTGPILLRAETVSGQVWGTSLFCLLLLSVFCVILALCVLKKNLFNRNSTVISPFLIERLKLYAETIKRRQGNVTSTLWSNINYRLWIDAQHYSNGGLVTIRMEVVLSIFLVYAVMIFDAVAKPNPVVWVVFLILVLCSVIPIIHEIFSYLVYLRKLNNELQVSFEPPQEHSEIYRWLESKIEERKKVISGFLVQSKKGRWNWVFIVPMFVFLVCGFYFEDKGGVEFFGFSGTSVWPCVGLFFVTTCATHWWLKKYGNGGLPWIPKLGGVDSLLPFRNGNEVGNIPCLNTNELKWTLDARTYGTRTVGNWIPISTLLSITTISRSLSLFLLFLVFVWQVDFNGVFPWSLLPLPPVRGILAIVIAIFGGTLSLFLCLRVSFTALSHVYFFWRFTRFIRGKWKVVLNGHVNQADVAKEWGSKEAWQKEKIEDLYWVCDFTQSGSSWLLKHALWYPSLILLLFAFSRLPILETWQVNSETIILVAGFPIMAGLISAIFLRGECKRLREMACGILSDWSVNPEVAYEAPNLQTVVPETPCTDGRHESAEVVGYESVESPGRVVASQHPNLDDLRKLAESIRGRIERMTGGAFVSLWNDPVVGSLLAIITAMASGPGKGIVDSLLKFAFN